LSGSVLLTALQGIDNYKSADLELSITYPVLDSEIIVFEARFLSLLLPFLKENNFVPDKVYPHQAHSWPIIDVQVFLDAIFSNYQKQYVILSEDGTNYTYRPVKESVGYVTNKLLGIISFKRIHPDWFDNFKHY
jgi:hypothetical protein